MQTTFRLALALSLLASAGHAAANSYSLTYFSHLSDGSASELTEYETVPDDFATSTSTHPAGDLVFGTHVDLGVAAQTGALAAGVLHAEWQAPLDPKVTRISHSAKAQSDMIDAPLQTTAGRVRFVVDYDLAASGEGSQAGISFEAQVLRVSGVPGPHPFDYRKVNLYQTAASSDPGGSRSGSWTSDWFLFSDTAAVHAVNPNVDPFSVDLSSWASYGAASLDGRADARSIARVRYEIAPVPEPETYALTAVGLAALAARRLQRRKAA